MPTLSEFFGLKVCMYREDSSSHHYPHVHIYVADCDAVVRIPDGEVMEADDDFPRSKMRLAQVWIDLHANELMENWQLIGADKKIFKIAPLEVR